MTFDEWEARHPIAAAELRALALPPCTELPVGSDESAVNAQLRLEASKKGKRLFRNNVGAAHLTDGTFVRFGLANDSQTVNKVLKSGDLIGIAPVLITPAHVGTTIGQFVSRESKRPGWKYKATERERAQLNWASIILSLGGDAAFATGTGTL